MNILGKELWKVSELKTNSDYLFEIMRKLVSECPKGEMNNGLYDLLEKLLPLIDKELELLISEHVREVIISETLADLDVGYTLQKMVELLGLLAKHEELKNALKKGDKPFMYYTISAFLKIRKLLTIQNKALKDAEKTLQDLFETLSAENEEDKKGFIAHCLKLLDESKEDTQVQTFLYEELSKVISPQKKERTYYLHLEKAMSQDIFIRGHMTKNPYKCSDIGDTMKDIRSKICKDLELRDAEELMELLVGGQLVGLDLNIRLVYEKVWWPHRCRESNPDLIEIPDISTAEDNQICPMLIIYRLAGLDGEATENRVENLSENRENAEPEVEFKLAATLTRDLDSGETGLSIMIKHLQNLGSMEKHMYFARSLINMISLATKLKENRKLVWIYIYIYIYIMYYVLGTEHGRHGCVIRATDSVPITV